MSITLSSILIAVVIVLSIFSSFRSPFSFKWFGRLMDPKLQTAISSLEVFKVISVQRLFDHHPIRIKKIKKDRLLNFVLPENERLRRQDLKPPAYIRNGSIYAMTRKTLVRHKSKMGKIARPYIMPEERCINIDEKRDFLIAELIIKKNKKLK